MVCYNCVIRRGERIVRNDVDVELDGFVPIEGAFAAEMQWGGILRPPNNIGLMVDEEYILSMPNFGPARIIVTSEANPHDGSVDFKGIGEPPSAKERLQTQSAE